MSGTEKPLFQLLPSRLVLARVEDGVGFGWVDTKVSELNFRKWGLETSDNDGEYASGFSRE